MHSKVVNVNPNAMISGREDLRVRPALEKSGTPIGPLDTQIGAHALSLGAVLVTHNTREFRRISGLAIEDWLA